MRKVFLTVVILIFIPLIRFTTAFSNFSPSLEAQPYEFFLTAEREATITLPIKVTNTYEDNEALEYTVLVKNIYTDSNGLIRDDDEGRELHSNLAQWIISPSETITIAKNETKDLIFTINVPAEAADGSHAAAIHLNGSIFTYTIPVLLTVNSNLYFNPSVQSITTEPQNIFTSGDISVKTFIENKGNVYFRPYGDIFIHRGDKNKPVEIYSFNEEGDLVLPDYTIGYVNSISGNKFIDPNESSFFKKYKFINFFNTKFGKYYATYQPIIKIADETQTKEMYMDSEGVTTVFYVIPIQYVISVVIVSLILMLYVVRVIRKKRKDKLKSVLRMRQ